MIRSAVVATALVFTVGSAQAARHDSAARSVGVIVDGIDAPRIGPRLRVAVRTALADDAQLRVRTLELGVEPANDPLDLADGANTQAARFFEQLDLDRARTDVTKAIAGYEEHLPRLVERDGNARHLRDAQILLAKIEFFGGDFDRGKDVLRRAFVLDPKLVYSARLFPPQMKRAVVEARLLFDTLGAGVIDVRSEPQGAEIWLNGMRLPHRTPSRVDAEAGPNTIELRLPGYRTARHSAEITTSGHDTQVSLPLERDPTPAGRAREATFAIGADHEPSELGALAGSLDVDALVLIHAAMKSDTQVVLVGALFDRTRGVPTAREERTVVLTELETEVDGLVRSLVGHLENSRPSATNDTRDDGSAHDFRNSRYFWWVVGGAAGVVALGIAVGVGVGVTAHNNAVAREVVLLGGQ